MAQTKKILIFRNCKSSSGGASSQTDNSKFFPCYKNDDSSENSQGSEDSSRNEIVTNTSSNLVDFLRGRELGNQKIQGLGINKEFGTRHLLEKNLLTETEIPLKYLNKVFCSQWLSGHQIIFGTKCNKLFVLDQRTSQFVLIPSLGSNRLSTPPEIECGIHSIQVNPSRTLLATGALNPNDVAVYKLPTMDPVCVGEGAHKDWIFDIVWLDDEFFVSGSRDTTIALWRVKEISNPCFSSIPLYHIISPLIVEKCKLAQKVRALAFNSRCQELVALSLNAYLHLYDIEAFRQKVSCRLPFNDENVCLAMQSDHSLYAVGSKSHITLIDSRTLCPIKTIPSHYESCSVRSTCFTGNILSVGTGIGIMMFYDIRANKYLHYTKKWSNGIRCKQATLKTNKGWVFRDDFFGEVYYGTNYAPAIYTHCYDPSGTKLFAAGGPLPASVYGNYAALWQ